jgi:hypothetical protein
MTTPRGEERESKKTLGSSRKGQELFACVSFWTRFSIVAGSYLEGAGKTGYFYYVQMKATKMTKNKQ